MKYICIKNFIGIKKGEVCEIKPYKSPISHHNITGYLVYTTNSQHYITSKEANKNFMLLREYNIKKLLEE